MHDKLTFLLVIGKANNRMVPNIDLLRKHLLREGQIAKKDLLELITDVTKIMSR